MMYLMGGLAILFVVALLFYFLTSLREERGRPSGGMPNRAG